MVGFEWLGSADRSILNAQKHNPTTICDPFIFYYHFSTQNRIISSKMSVFMITLNTLCHSDNLQLIINYCFPCLVTPLITPVIIFLFKEVFFRNRDFVYFSIFQNNSTMRRLNSTTKFEKTTVSNSRENSMFPDISMIQSVGSTSNGKKLKLNIFCYFGNQVKKTITITKLIFFI